MVRTNDVVSERVLLDDGLAVYRTSISLNLGEWALHCI